jgi:hypothetical protein
LGFLGGSEALLNILVNPRLPNFLCDKEPII